MTEIERLTKRLEAKQRKIDELRRENKHLRQLAINNPRLLQETVNHLIVVNRTLAAGLKRSCEECGKFVLDK